MTGGASDVTFICISNAPRLCLPCTIDSECRSLTGDGDRCVSYGDGGSYCGAACGADADCPTGFECRLDDTKASDTTRPGQCVATTGQCPCSSRAVEIGLSTGCHTTNSVGACPGQRQCTPLGLTTCDAPVPTQELCNRADDDCDGVTDHVPCDDALTCTTDLCAGASGCVHEPASAGACDDGDVCTSDDVCVAGVCLGTEAACDDQNDCTDDSCGETGACDFTPASHLCDDGDACSVGDACALGDCQPGVAINCHDDNVCTEDSCDNVLGCLHAPNAATCFDGDVCTGADTCQGGSCTPGSGLNCNDDDACTIDACEPATGCTHAGIAGCGQTSGVTPGVPPLCEPPGIGVLFPLVQGETSVIALLELADTELGQRWIGLVRYGSNGELRYQLLTGDGCKIGPDKGIGTQGTVPGEAFGIVELPSGGFAMWDAEGLRGFDLYGVELWRDDDPDDHGSGGQFMVATGPDTVEMLPWQNSSRPVLLRNGSYVRYKQNAGSTTRFLEFTTPGAGTYSLDIGSQDPPWNHQTAARLGQDSVASLTNGYATSATDFHSLALTYATAAGMVVGPVQWLWSSNYSYFAQPLVALESGGLAGGYLRTPGSGTLELWYARFSSDAGLLGAPAELLRATTGVDHRGVRSSRSGFLWVTATAKDPVSGGGIGLSGILVGDVCKTRRGLRRSGGLQRRHLRNPRL